MWNWHMLKEHSNRVYLPPRPTLQRVCQGLSLLIQSLKPSPLSIVMFLVLSRAPPSIALLGFLNIREKEKGLKPPFHGPTCDASFSVHMNSFVNPNSEVSLQNKVNLTPIYAAIPSFQIAATMVNIWHIPKKA
ncbi:hypothetical protein D0Y65_053301 [Glycine soja]|uniref:Uncharacterized protein n=1 Tax=Glycine soja TaxID=3848 RepID=A0A445F1E4_GLYSO|nr:hypothetical protein D0Y65_053301 [Glycine soja]